MRMVRRHRGDDGEWKTQGVQRMQISAVLWQDVPEGGLAHAQGHLQTPASCTRMIPVSCFRSVGRQVIAAANWLSVTEIGKTIMLLASAGLCNEHSH